MAEETIRKLAEEHWEYVGSICEKMYIDAFIHGYKHAQEETVDREWLDELLNETFMNGFRLGYHIAQRDDLILCDKLKIFGEPIPELNPQNVDNYYISC